MQHSGPHKAGTGTLVKLRHSGFADYAKDVADHGQGWQRVLGWMQAWVERGETVDRRS